MYSRTRLFSQSSWLLEHLIEGGGGSVEPPRRKLRQAKVAVNYQPVTYDLLGGYRWGRGAVLRDLLLESTILYTRNYFYPDISRSLMRQPSAMEVFKKKFEKKFEKKFVFW